VRAMINFIVSDLLDTTRTNLEDAALADINAAMKRVAGRIKAILPDAQITEGTTENTVVKLTVRSQGVQIKIEVTPVLRGCVFEPAMMSVRPAVEEDFGFAEARIVSFADLYAGKIVAALDRQHPRDLFDVRDLFANEGITDDLRQAFIVYLLSHDRPMSEVLASTLINIESAFTHGFSGMTRDPVELADLLAARVALIKSVVGDMSSGHREFLVSFERGKPNWDLLGLSNAAELPAVRWRQQNLDKLSSNKRALLVTKLEEVLSEET